MNEKLFGTDGIRGIPGQYPLTGDVIKKVGFAAASVLSGRGQPPFPSKKWDSPHVPSPFVIIGRDSRKSGIAIGRVLCKGIRLAGCGVCDIGIVPTPAVSYLTPRLKAVCGVVISASHNPPEFNGIKFFSSEGFKLDEDMEREIESRIKDTSHVFLGNPPAARGARKYGKYSLKDYVDFIKTTAPADVDFSGIKLVLDCANGAAYKIAPRVFRELGADVSVIGSRPDGSNINVGFGALETKAMLERTVRIKADCGISLDGDADRAIFADERGAILDGDDLMSMVAAELSGRGRLRRNKIVVTVMSNYGLLRYLDLMGIDVVQVPVGDRNVTAALESEGLILGGEASGHLIFREFGPTGDGILTAVQILCIMKRSGKPLSWFRKKWTRYPQVLESILVPQKIPLEAIAGFKEKVRQMEKRLGGKGRIFVRYSGTEPLLRVLVEGPSKKTIVLVASEIIKHYKQKTQGHPGRI